MKGFEQQSEMVRTMTNHESWTEAQNEQENWLDRSHVTDVENSSHIMTSSNLTPSSTVSLTKTSKSHEIRCLQTYSFIQYTLLEPLSYIREYTICGDSSVQKLIRNVKLKHSESKWSSQISNFIYKIFELRTLSFIMSYNWL